MDKQEIFELIQELDSDGLIITDEDMIKKALGIEVHTGGHNKCD